MDCKQIEGSLAAVVDGGAPPDEVARVARHLESCPACREAVQAQTTARAVLRARVAQLSVVAPPGLRTRIIASAPSANTRIAANRPEGDVACALRRPVWQFSDPENLIRR